MIVQFIKYTHARQQPHNKQQLGGLRACNPKRKKQLGVLQANSSTASEATEILYWQEV